jgi:hypothetical protein
MPESTSLLTPEDMSNRLRGVISAERLVELAEAGFAPHYTVDGQVMFGCTETKEWVNHNLVVRHQGQHIGDGIITIINVIPPGGESPPAPTSLRGMAGKLIPISIKSAETVGCPGVYFLCHEGQVVYVGQSVNVFSRVGAHLGEKSFDSAFFVRVPRSDLDYVEGALIRSLSPKYNGRTKNGKMVGPIGYAEPSDECAMLVSSLAGESEADEDAT